MRLKLIIISLLFLLFAIIAVQNTIITELKFLFWSIPAPLIVMIVVIFIIGLIIGLIFCSRYESNKRKEGGGIQLKKEDKDKPADKNSIK